MFLTALIAGLVLLRIFAADQLVEENEPAGRSSVLIAGALNKALSASSNPQATFDAFVDELNVSGSDVIKFRRVGGAPRSPTDNDARRAGSGRVPAWFVRLLGLPELKQYTPIVIQRERVGDLIFEPDMVADIYEKWIGFLAIVASGIALTIFTLAITYVTVDAALRPLRDLGAGLARLRDGHYASRIACVGPPEIRESCDAANELADTLTQLNRENRNLMRKMVSIQDDERRDIARELHDELGPLLFAIRANVIAMVDSGAFDQDKSDFPAQKVLQSVEALQSTNRRILDRLRPMHIEELGLQVSIQKLLRGVRSQAPAIDVVFEIDPALEAVDGVVSQTVYRVLQEGITNVLRHAGANQNSLDGYHLGRPGSRGDFRQRGRHGCGRRVWPRSHGNARKGKGAGRNFRTIPRRWANLCSVQPAVRARRNGNQLASPRFGAISKPASAIAARTALAMQCVSSILLGPCPWAPCCWSVPSLHSRIAVAIMAVNWKWSAMLRPAFDRREFSPAELDSTCSLRFDRHRWLVVLRTQVTRLNSQRKRRFRRIACFARGTTAPPGFLISGPNMPRSCRIIPIHGNQPTPPRLTGIVDDVEQPLMKPLASFGRNDVIRAIALVSVVAFPLIADAQLGLGTKAVKLSSDVSPLVTGTAKAAIAERKSCADQHWPFFSSGCLRGSAEAIEARVVSMDTGSPKDFAATDDPARGVGATDAGRANAPLAKPKKPSKPRAAAPRHERRNIGVTYAVNSEAGHMSLAGW